MLEEQLLGKKQEEASEKISKEFETLPENLKEHHFLYMKEYRINPFGWIIDPDLMYEFGIGLLKGGY
jgi:hypothetical protein